MLIVRQVDDLLLWHKDLDECDQMAKELQNKLTFPLNFLGIVWKFNGVNVGQTCHYSHIHCSTYIGKIIKHHEWENVQSQTPPTPFWADNKPHQADIQTTKGSKNPKDALNLQI